MYSMFAQHSLLTVLTAAVLIVMARGEKEDNNAVGEFTFLSKVFLFSWFKLSKSGKTVYDRASSRPYRWSAWGSSTILKWNFRFKGIYFWFSGACKKQGKIWILGKYFVWRTYVFSFSAFSFFISLGNVAIFNVCLSLTAMLLAMADLRRWAAASNGVEQAHQQPVAVDPLRARLLPTHFTAGRRVRRGESTAYPVVHASWFCA